MVTHAAVLRGLIHRVLKASHPQSVPISEIYDFIEANLDFDSDDFIPPNLHGQPIKEPRWRRNVRNVLKSDTDNNLITNVRRGEYSLPGESPKAGDLWNANEIDAAVDSWIKMLEYQQSGEPFVKAQIIRQLRSEVLNARSKSSVERRFQNISAVAMALDIEWIRGLPPLSNVGSTNWERIQRRLQHQGMGGEIEITIEDELEDLQDTMKSESPEEYESLKSMNRIKERAWQLVTQRRGQNKFRRVLLDTYGERCVITRFNSPAALEAAHIEPYSGPSSNVPTNGLLLRSDIHKMFDKGLLGIEPDGYTAVLSPDLQNSSYAQHEGQRIILPEREALLPDRNLLNDHLELAMSTW